MRFRLPIGIAILSIAPWAMAEDFVVKVVRAKDTGNQHYSDKAKISYADADLDLTKATLGYSPLGMKSYRLDEKSCLFWAWSSGGGGTEDHHLYVVAARNGKPELIDQLLLTCSRGSAFCSVRWEAPGIYSIFLGGEGNVPDGESHLTTPNGKEHPVNSFTQESPQAREAWLKQKDWLRPYLDGVPGTLDWGMKVRCDSHGLRLPAKQK